MSLTEGNFMGLHHYETQPSDMGAAVAAELRRRYPHHAAKSVARDLGCTVKTAENLLAHHLSGKSITRLGAVYGPKFLVDAVMAMWGTSLDKFILDQAEKALNEQRKWELEQQRLKDLAESVRGARLWDRPRSKGPGLGI